MSCIHPSIACHQVNLFLEEIAARLNAGKLRGVKCVPASDVAASEAAYHGVPLTTLQVRGGAGWGRQRWSQPLVLFAAAGGRDLNRTSQLQAPPMQGPSHACTCCRLPSDTCAALAWPPLLQAAPKLDLFIEVADEMSSAPEGNLAFIIGRRQKPAQVRGGLWV